MLNICNIIKTSTGFKVQIEVKYNNISLFRKELRNFIRKHYYFNQIVDYIYVSSDLFGGFINRDFSVATNSVIYNIFNSEEDSLVFLDRFNKTLSLEFFFSKVGTHPTEESTNEDPLLNTELYPNPEDYIRDNFCYFDKFIYYNKTFFRYSFNEFENQKYILNFDNTLKELLSQYYVYFNYKYNTNYILFKLDKPFVLTGLFDGNNIINHFQSKLNKDAIREFFENISDKDTFQNSSGLLDNKFTFTSDSFSNIIPIEVNPTNNDKLTHNVSLRSISLQLPYFIYYFNTFFFKLYNKDVIKTKTFLEEKNSDIKYYFGRKFYISEINLSYNPKPIFYKYIFNIQIVYNNNKNLQVEYYLHGNTEPSFIYIIQNNEIIEKINFNYFIEPAIITPEDTEYKEALNQYSKIKF